MLSSRRCPSPIYLLHRDQTLCWRHDILISNNSFPGSRLLPESLGTAGKPRQGKPVGLDLHKTGSHLCSVNVVVCQDSAVSSCQGAETTMRKNFRFKRTAVDHSLRAPLVNSRRGSKISGSTCHFTYGHCLAGSDTLWGLFVTSAETPLRCTVARMKHSIDPLPIRIQRAQHGPFITTASTVDHACTLLHHNTLGADYVPRQY